MSIRHASKNTVLYIVVWFLCLCFIPKANVIAGETVFPGKDWVEKTPYSQGVDPAKLDDALKYLEGYCGEDGIREVVVIRNGYMIWKGDNVDKQHSTWSIGKSFTSTALGLLIEDGLCTLDDYAYKYEPLLSGKYSRVKLRHLNTMTSGYDAPKGLRWKKPVPEFGDWSPAPYVPGAPLFSPGEAYLYWDEAMMMFGRILTRIAKQDLYSFFETRIANPIGIDKWDWETEGELNGLKIRTGCGMVWISAKNLARFGYLFLNRGNWNGKQLINTAWIDEATSVQVSPSTPLFRDICDEPGKFSDGGHFDADGRGVYGYHWWVNGIDAGGKRNLPDAPAGMFYRTGYPHNMLFVIPEWNMVIVRLGDEPDGRPGMDRMTLWNNVLKKVGDAIIEKQQKTAISGDLKKWHTAALSFTGPEASESDNFPNPFLDYRLNVTFTGPSGQVYVVPGFYDGDGNGNGSGNIWKARFTPDEAGIWKYKTSFRKGSRIAVSLDIDAGSSAGYFDGTNGFINIANQNPDAPGFLKWGRLEYVNDFYLKFRDGSYWIKGGADSPENFLAYGGFDNTLPNPHRPEFFHSYNSHVKDWKNGDPDWGNNEGRGIIGALNYLSEKNVNSIYVLLMNIGGDGQDVWPYSGNIDRKGSPDNDNLHFDIGKLSQWETVFAHAQKKGINIQFVLNEGEEENKKELDNGKLDIERKLYYREMISRFGHHNALQWNLCEEHDIRPFPWLREEIRGFSRYIRSLDPYRHPVTVHNWSMYALENIWGDPNFSVTSIQYYPEQRVDYIGDSYLPFGEQTEMLRAKAESVWRKIPVYFDEFDRLSSVDNMQHDEKKWPYLSGHSFLRKNLLWPVYLSGGAVEYILEDLLETEDFRKYERMWEYTWNARKFMEQNLPFWEMEPCDHLLIGEATLYQEDGQVFAKNGYAYAIYLPNSALTGKLDLRNVAGTYTKQWYNPRTGNFEGAESIINGGKLIPLGTPPDEKEEDWVLLIKLK